MIINIDYRVVLVQPAEIVIIEERVSLFESIPNNCLNECYLCRIVQENQRTNISQENITYLRS